MSYDECPSCGASGGQGCYSTCLTLLQARVAELEAALRDIIADSYSVYAIQVARAALNRTAQENNND